MIQDFLDTSTFVDCNFLLEIKKLLLALSMTLDNLKSLKTVEAGGHEEKGMKMCSIKTEKFGFFRNSQALDVQSALLCFSAVDKLKVLVGEKKKISLSHLNFMIK